MKKLLLILPFWLTACILIAQDISFTASAPSSVTEGQQFKLIFTLNAQGSGFKAPDLSSFKILGGPSTSTSSNISFTNGVMNQSMTNSYTYYLQAKTEGTYTINPASVVAGGKTYSSNKITIQVTKGSTSNQQNQNSQNNQQSQQGQETSGEDLFVRIILSKDNIYQGEQIIATIKIYTRVNLVGFEEFKFPTYKGFWAEEVEIPNQISLVQENYNGKAYNVGVLKKTILFPQKSGDLTIEPFEIKLMVQERVQQQPRNFWDNFFNSYQTVSKRLVSPSVRVKVKPLPSSPAGFNGAVGNYNITSKASPLQLKSNESINLSYTISGNGNLRLIKFPEPVFPPQFETYDPKIAENIKVSVNGVAGSRTSEQLLIPRSAGKYTINSPPFIFFNPTTGKYQTIQIEPYTVQVEKGANDSSVAFVSGYNKEDLTLLGSDIRFISTDKPELVHIGTSLWVNPFYKGGYALLILAFTGIIISRRRYIKRNADMMMVKNRRAGREANKRLSKAKKLMQKQQTDLFYEEILKALWGYYADKLKIPVSLLSKDIIIEKLKEQLFEEGLLEDIRSVIDECEFSRYAPAGTYAAPANIYERTTSVINETEKKIKKI